MSSPIGARSIFFGQQFLGFPSTTFFNMAKFHLPFAGLLMFAAGCSNQFQAYSDYDPDMDVRVYKTYAWPDRTEIEARNNPLLYNELTDKRIRKAVDKQLSMNGYVLSDSAPQLKVHYHIVVRDKINERLDDPRADSYSPYWLERGRNTFRYEEGTLIVDLMDATNCNIIWRGWAVGVIDEYTSTLSEQEITEAIHVIFKNYPKHPRTRVESMP